MDRTYRWRSIALWTFVPSDHELSRGGGEASPAVLAQNLLTLTPFQKITKEEYRELLLYMLDRDQLEKTETGTLMIGLRGSRRLTIMISSLFLRQEKRSPCAIGRRSLGRSRSSIHREQDFLWLDRTGRCWRLNQNRGGYM
ncbi:MAG: hypothetical protein ACLR23_17680 [Clostridia bacterium]